MIKDIEKRKAYKELWDEHEALRDKEWEIEKPIRNAMDAAREPIWAEYYAKVEAAEKPFKEQIEAATKDCRERMKELEEQMESLGLGSRVYNEDYTHAFSCEVTGLPIFADDDVITDGETGDMILRDAIKPAAIA